MASYTSDANLQIELPSPLPSALTSAIRTQYISDASSEVDAKVGRRYSMSYNSNVQKFPEIDDSPATPAIIEQAARWLAASRCFRKIAEINRDPSGETIADDLQEKAWEQLRQIHDDELDVFDTAGSDLAATNPLMSSTMDDIDQSFTRGNYTDGSLVSDEAGTLDDF